MRSIVLTDAMQVGGTSLLEGLSARLVLEIQFLRGLDDGVHSPPTRRFYAWIGGSKFASTR